MSNVTRRDFLRYGTALASATGLSGAYPEIFAQGLESVGTGRTKVAWLEAMSCTGCSVSFLNTENPGPLEVVTEVISLVYHGTVGAAQGEDCFKVLDTVTEQSQFVLVVEGAIPEKMPEACAIGERPLNTLLVPMLRKAKAVLAAGTCAAFGGVPAAEGNITGATSVQNFMKSQGIPTEGRLVNCPGCPVHPESLVGTIAYLASKGCPPLDPQLLAPKMFYSNSVHDECPRFHYWEKQEFAKQLGDPGCLFELGCLGPLSHTGCPRHQWNGGVNWCIRAGAPCIACTSQQFASLRSFPFYRKHETVVPLAART
jgi:hydrogenase small subunit